VPIVVPLVALDVLVVALWCIAVALAIALVMDKLSSILAGVPWVGGKLSDAVKSMAKAITNAAGTIEGGIDHLIGGAWHALARYMDKLWSQFAAHSTVLLHIARIVGHLVHAQAGLRALVHGVTGIAHGISHLVKVLEREYHGIEHRVKTIERELGRGIGNDVRAHIKALERELHGIEKRVIPGLRQGIQATEGELTELERWLGVKAGLSNLDWAKALVLTALGALGLSGLRCSTLGNLFGKRGCGLWSGLDDLLSLLFDAAIFVDLCALLPELEALFAEFEAPLVSLVATAADAACAHPPAGWVELAAPSLSLPAVYYAGPVPGN
jgi:hypothetical protein